jgi:4-carboxymuconolactone decarboxylase
LAPPPRFSSLSTDERLASSAVPPLARLALNDTTFAALCRRWSDGELVELVALVGFYRMVSGFLNTMGVEPEKGLPGWPASAG